MPELSRDMFRDAGGAVSDIFNYVGSQYRVQGNRYEAANYRRAAGFADTNALLTDTSTRLKSVQQERQTFQQIGTVQSDVAGSGFTQGGSALDILRSVAQQGSLERAVGEMSGEVAEEGYRVQSENYRGMAAASDLAARSQETSGIGSLVSAAVRVAPYALMLL